MTMDRLPDNIKSFVMQHYHLKPENDNDKAIQDQDQVAKNKEEKILENEINSKNESTTEAEKKKKKAGKFTPKPPPGPPPADAVVN
jgi:hypothetical protein